MFFLQPVYTILAFIAVRPFIRMLCVLTFECRKQGGERS
jgi:hypothetical protein